AKPGENSSTFTTTRRRRGSVSASSKQDTRRNKLVELRLHGASACSKSCNLPRNVTSRVRIGATRSLSTKSNSKGSRTEALTNQQCQHCMRRLDRRNGGLSPEDRTNRPSRRPAEPTVRQISRAHAARILPDARRADPAQKYLSEMLPEPFP